MGRCPTWSGARRRSISGSSSMRVGAAGCALSPSIGWLIAFRAVQGVGAASVMVIPRAIIRDLHTGVEGARLMALVMLVISVSPILAPVTGSALIVPFGWRAVFVAVTIAAVLALGLLATMLPETLAAGEPGAAGAGKRHFELRDADARPAFPRADLHRRARHGELLHVSRQCLIHLHRSLRPRPDGILHRLFAERHRLHRLLATCRLARRPLWPRQAGDGGGRRAMRRCWRCFWR